MIIWNYFSASIDEIETLAFLRLFAHNRLVISKRISMSLYTANIPEVMEACEKQKQRGGVFAAQR